MFKPLSLSALACALFLVAVFADDLATTTCACKTCSTTVTVYKVQRKSTSSFSEYATYPAEDGSITYVYTGTSTVARPALTTTTTVQSTIYDTDPVGYFQTRTRTISSSGATTTTMCKKTKTPSDYPTPQYCQCDATPTSVIKKPITIGTLGVVYTYDSTKTVPHTSFGHTTTFYNDVSIDTYVPDIYYVDFTKTVYETTKTKTLPPFKTPSDFSTFKLQVVNNPAITQPAFLVNTYVCISAPFPPYCQQYGDVVFADSNKDDATVWQIVNGSLYDMTNNLTCGFASYHIDAGPQELAYTYYTIDCTPGNPTVGPVTNLDIDCFGNLVTYQGEANTWGYASNGALPAIALYAQPDPVHGYDDAGDSDYVTSPEYAALKVVFD